MPEDLLGGTKFRSLSGPARALERFLFCALTLVGAVWAGEVHVFLGLAFFKEQYLGLFVALAIPLAFIAVKARRSQTGDEVPWYDWLFALGGAVAGGYILVRYPPIAC